MDLRSIVNRLSLIEAEMPVGTMPVALNTKDIEALKLKDPQLFKQMLQANPQLAMTMNSPVQGATQQSVAPGTQAQPAPSVGEPAKQPVTQQSNVGGSSQVPAKNPIRPQEGYDDFSNQMSKLTDDFTTEEEKPKMSRWEAAKDKWLTSNDEKARRQQQGADDTVQGWIDNVAKDPKNFSNVPPQVKRQVYQGLPEGPAKDNALIQLHLEKNKKMISTVTDPKEKARLDAERQDLMKRQANVLKPKETPVDGKKEEPPVATPPVDDKKPVDGKKEEPPVATPPVDGKKEEPPVATPPVDDKKEEPPVKKRAWGQGVVGKGMTGPQVSAVQDKLFKLGYLGSEKDVDGNFGPITQAAVQKFQADQGLKGREGAVGSETRPALDAALTNVKPVQVNAPAPVTQASPEADADAAYAASQAQEKLIAQGKERAQIKAMQDRFKDVDPSQVIHQTGNMGKAHYDLKNGDVDYDARGVKHVYQKTDAGPGNWQASFDKFSDWQNEPGLGIVGNSASSDAGKDYVAKRQARIVSPADKPVYDKAFPAKPEVAPVAPTAPKADGGPEVVDATATVPKKVEGFEQFAESMNSLKDEFITEWSMSDKIHPDVPYTGWDAATDAGIAGLGALATYATGGLAAPVAGAATVARGGRLANMLYKGVQGTKNVAQGVKAIATNPEARALANQATSKGKLATGAGKALAGDAAMSVGVSTAADKLDKYADSLENTTESYKTELDRITHLAKR